MQDELFKEKYRARTVRIEGYDYGTDGAYFITICSHQKTPIFSEIREGIVHLLPLGKIIREEWESTPAVRGYVTVLDIMIMPDHIHGIIFIHKDSGTPERLPQKGIDLYFPEGYKNRYGGQSGNLASIIRGFKSVVTKRAKAAGLDLPVWQKNYYEHIIRNHEELERVIVYIENNPITWQQKNQEKQPNGDINGRDSLGYDGPITQHKRTIRCNYSQKNIATRSAGIPIIAGAVTTRDSYNESLPFRGKRSAFNSRDAHSPIPKYPHRSSGYSYNTHPRCRKFARPAFATH
jgi:putative transposase